MSTVGTIYGPKAAPKVLRAMAAANYNGVKLDVKEVTVAAGDTKTPEYLEKFPHGKIPGFVSSEGLNLFEGRAIARYVAGISSNSNLLGNDAKSAALVEQWISFGDDELLTPAMTIFYLTKGFWPYNKNIEEKAWTNLNRGFATLESYLKKQTFLVGHRVTLADLTVAANLSFMYTHAVGQETRDQYPNVTRYFQTVTNQAQTKDLFANQQYMTENVKFVPPKKEEKPKAAAPAAAAKKEEKPKASKKKDDDDDDGDDTPAPPKAAPHPCASLPPSPFVLDEAKRQYSNLDTPDFMKWFYENFDKDGYSIWKVTFKYQEELTLVFMASNQIAGFWTRLEASRKYVMGNGGVYGGNNDAKIAAVVICRGKQWEPVLGVAPDVESYAVSPLDPFNSAEDKEFFEGNLSWEGTFEGKSFADGKMLK